jgi:hypothetical protein
MRLLTLVIALVALFGVAYVNFSTPSRAAVFDDDMKLASITPGR